MSADPQTVSHLSGGEETRAIFRCLSLLLITTFCFVSQFGKPVYCAELTSRAAASYPELARPIGYPANATALLPQVTSDGEAGKLFGMETELVADSDLAEKWRGMKAGIAQDLETVARCYANGPCPAAAPILIAIIAEGVGHSGVARIGLINRAVNLAIVAMSDQAQLGSSHHWCTPLETFQSDRGDCQDYAIVKFAAMLGAGIPENDAKIVIFKHALREDQFLLAVRVAGQWFVLDNGLQTLVHEVEINRAIPSYVLDQDGVSRFVRTNASRGPHS